MTTSEENKGLKDRTDLESGPIYLVKVDYIEGKPKYPLYVLLEETMGHDTYHAPGDHRVTAKARG